MSAIDYMKQSLAFVHGAYRQATEGLTPDQIHFVPEGESHSIAWIVWHGARVEDLIMQQFIKGVPQEWESGGWAARTGLPVQGFGTGQTTEEARTIRIAGPEEFAKYAARVAGLTQEFLSSVSESDLEREIQAGRRVETVGQSINLHLVTHLNGHRGEINLLRGMMGFPPVMPNQGG